MRRSLLSAPDTFSLNPLLALLPVRGDIGRLSGLTGSLFARYERVTSLQRETSDGLTAEARRRMSVEEAMLKQILDWLEVRPENGTEEV